MTLQRFFRRPRKMHKLDNAGGVFLAEVFTRAGHMDYVRNILRAERPDLRGSGIAVTPAGTHVGTYRVGGEYFKFPLGDAALHRFEQEWRVMDTLHNAGLPVPALTTLGEYHIFYGMKAVEGITLRESKLAHEDLYDAGRDTAKFIIDMAKAAMGLQDVFTISANLDHSLPNPSASMITHTVERLDGLVPAGDAQVCRAALRVYEASLPDVPLVLCHADMHADNIIVNRGRLSGVIDFGYVTWDRFERAVWDVVNYDHVHTSFNRGIMDAVLDSADPYVDAGKKRAVAAYALCAAVKNVNWDYPVRSRTKLVTEAAATLAKVERRLSP